MNPPNDPQDFIGKTRPASPRTTFLLVDKYWSDPEAAGVRWLHLWVVASSDHLGYSAMLTLGAGRGEGFGLPELADQVTRELETVFTIPANRVVWGIRLLSPVSQKDAHGDQLRDGIGRIDHFYVEARDGKRQAIACPTAHLVSRFHQVLLPQPPTPPRSFTGF